MLTLYHAPRSRSSSIVWLLEELGEPYRIEITPIVYGNGQGQSAPETYRRIHPHKKVPAIDHDGTIVFECAAIALYLADSFPKARLAPAIGDRRRGAYVTWLAYWAGVMNPVVAARFRGWDNDSPTGFGDFDEMENFMAQTLARHPYIVGDSFTAADVLVGGAIGFFSGTLLPKREVYDGYLERLAARPARQRAMARDDG
ncbi:MAG TPA: glutathione S-transferase family protein [Rhizomicrobium sp.]